MKTELSSEKINYGTVIAEEGNWTEEGFSIPCGKISEFDI